MPEGRLGEAVKLTGAPVPGADTRVAKTVAETLVN